MKKNNDNKAAFSGLFRKEPEDVISAFHPQVIIVNACDAHTRSGRLIMNADDVIRTCEKSGQAAVIASHTGAVSHARLSRSELKNILKDTPYDSRVMIPEDGEIPTI